jgi:protocatechuate 3,4-dioxygenase beta subunit
MREEDQVSDPIPFAPYAAKTQPDLDTPAYLGTRQRHPLLAPVRMPHTVTETSGPRFGVSHFPSLADMSRLNGREAIGERIIVAGTVTDGDGRPVPHTMLEIWQANACGRYDHPGDQHDAPLDPNFHGSGRVFTDADGRYRFVSVKPGAYPWPNHHNAWRPNHIHFSLFGAAFATRLITQMYFPGDPLLPLDPIYNSIADAAARERLVSTFDLDLTEPNHALGYRFDIVLRGRAATPMEH